MYKKVIWPIAILAIIISIGGNTGLALAAAGAQPSASGAQPINIPALSIPPASSLGVQFVQVATAANISGNSTIIDHPLTNNNPSAIILVTPDYNPGGIGGTYDNHSIGVYYSSGKWRIFNQDMAAMTANMAFNVFIPTPGAGVFVQTTTALNTSSNGTTIDNALSNGHPNAMVFVTANWNAGDGGGTYNNHSVGVWYDGTHWQIFNQDFAVMPLNAFFNVMILSAGAGVFVQTAVTGNIAGDYTVINNSLTNADPNAIIFVTPNRSPGGVGGAGYNHNLGVWFDGDKWAIFNQDIGSMPANVSFNVLVLVPKTDTFVHTTSASNSAGDYTRLDNSLTNGHPNAIIFTTPNWNPGGFGGTYNNHNTGVFYDSSTTQWAIFNQDIVTIPASASFNVVIPNPEANVFVHNATALNISGDATVIDNPLTNNNPNAILLVTPNWNPGNVGGIYNNHPIGVYYSLGKWWIFNQDLTAMPVNASFNVFLPTVRPGVAVFVHTTTLINTGGNVTDLDNPLTNNNPNAIILATVNMNPGGGAATFNNHPIGMYYTRGIWEIFNQDIASVPIGASFNVYVFANYKIFLPLVLR